MSFNVNLLSQICEAPGTSGFEQRIRELVIKQVTPLVDSVDIDNMGNVIALKKGSMHGKPECKKVMAAAHMDEIGFIISHIEENGFLHFHPIGGFDPKTLTAQRVIVQGTEDLIGVMGSKPIHLMSPDERVKPLRLEDFFIDLGMPYEEVIKIVSVGNPVTRERTLIEMGDCINCKSLDNRLSVFILIETLREMQKCPYDFYAVFTVQEEIGIRGATVSAHGIDPDFGFGLDVTIAYDVPGAKPEEMVTKLGGGTAIKIMDSSVICDYRMVRYMKKVATDHKLKWQVEVLPKGGTDTAGIQRMPKRGAIAGAVSIPCRHVHQVIEMSHKDDIRGSIDLLRYCVEEIDTADWAW
ncbi:MAG: putative aminopeptidase FrvX [Limisphaerales bacterium]|jgi:putative aminopeptidase FrvX